MAPADDDYTHLSSESKDRWFATVMPVVGGIVLFALAQFGGVAIHIWTSILFWHRWGLVWGVIAFGVPFFAEAVAVFVCFGWHIWYYVLAIGLWLTSWGAIAFANTDAKLPFRSMLFVGWICLLGVLSVSFGHYAWVYSLGPTSRTAADQAELEDCANAVVACVSFSASSDPNDLASVAKGKKAVKDTIKGYDRASLDEICSLVDDSLRVERSLTTDMMEYTEAASRTGEPSKFTVSVRTKQLLDKLPNKLRMALQADVAAAEKLNSDNVNPPKDWREMMKERMTSIWTIYGQTYSDLLGRPMPPLASD
jgi:hypothetical protein